MKTITLLAVSTSLALTIASAICSKYAEDEQDPALLQLREYFSSKTWQLVAATEPAPGRE